MRACLAVVSSVLALGVGTAWSAPVATPDVYRANRVEPDRQAYLEAVLKAYNDGTAKDPELNLLAVEMLEPDNKGVVAALSGYNSQLSSERRLVEILTLLPDNGNASYTMALNLEAQGYRKLAVPYYRAASNANPGSYSLHEKAGLNAYFAGEYQACIEFYDRSRATGHAYAMTGEAYLKRADCKAFSGQNARGDFLMAADLDPGLKSGWSYRMFEDKVFDGCKGSAAGQTQSAAKLLDKGKRYEAYRAVHIALQCDPAYIPAHETRLRIEDGDGNLAAHAKAHKHTLANLRDGGQTDAVRQAQLQPATVAQMLDEASRIDMKNGLRSIIRVAYLANRSLLIEPDNWQARLLRARALTNLNAPRLAPMAWNDVLFIDTVAAGPQVEDRATVLHTKGILLLRIDRHDDALDQYNQAIALTPGDLRFYVQRAGIYEIKGDYGAALRDIALVIGKEPRNVEARTISARVKKATKDYDGAIWDVQAILTQQPDHRGARAEMIRLLDLNNSKAEADALHRLFLIEDEDGAQGDPYLKSRATPQMVADARAEADRRTRYRAAEDANDRLNRYQARHEAASQELLSQIGRFKTIDGPQSRDKMRAYIDDVDDLIYRFNDLRLEAEAMLAADLTLLTPKQREYYVAYLTETLETNREALMTLIQMRKSMGGDVIKPIRP